ncbi:hypothetical protein TNCT_49771 [Trichonephila clavata]|uniref:Uncharacterized protein n=1 Tax=Trichonephila clavata TaxID=2740835 RepID=A0A8X6GY78_TRICU|nr:hypothetical protein TNCT_49771 [Trichonephila clavata]
MLQLSVVERTDWRQPNKCTDCPLFNLQVITLPRVRYTSSATMNCLDTVKGSAIAILPHPSWRVSGVVVGHEPSLCSLESGHLITGHYDEVSLHNKVPSWKYIISFMSSKR